MVKLWGKEKLKKRKFKNERSSGEELDRSEEKESESHEDGAMIFAACPEFITEKISKKSEGDPGRL